MQLGLICVLLVYTNYVSTFPTSNSNNDDNIYETDRKLKLEGHANAVIRNVGSSVLLQSFHECIAKNSLIKCTKIFLLCKMELNRNVQNTSNITRDMYNFFINDNTKETHESARLFLKTYMNMTDKGLNKLLVEDFQRFFKNRDIKLHFPPGLLIKFVPSKDNNFKFTLKKKGQSFPLSSGRSKNPMGDIEASYTNGKPNMDGHTKHQLLDSSDHSDEEGLGKLKNKKHTSYKSTVLQMAVPIMVMPAILLGTFLPFWLPVLKIATIITMIMNNTAFLASLIMAARTHANSQDEAEHISYSHPTYH